jgi:hypothetical protein
MLAKQVQDFRQQKEFNVKCKRGFQAAERVQREV